VVSKIIGSLSISVVEDRITEGNAITSCPMAVKTGMARPKEAVP